MFDSFASGLPVIQNTKGWIKDLIDKNGCGVNVEPENANSMADAIIYISDLDNEKLSTMKSAAHRLASIDFNRDLLSEKYLNSILSLL
jgi:glycosyltransferase involved in cell wall biosynthesis